MEFILDFDYDESVVDLYHEALANEYTSETRLSGAKFSRAQTENRLHETQKSKSKNGFDLHGILKVKVDGELAAICFPRKILSSEYDKYKLNPLNDYHRLSGIYVNPEFRGRGIALKIVEWFIDHFKFILWTADENNLSSIKVANKANLTKTTELDVKDQNEEYRYRLHVFSN